MMLETKRLPNRTDQEKSS